MSIENIINYFSDEITRAIVIAAIAHDKQKDNGEREYIFHPLYLASKMETKSAAIVAILHDVVEDGPFTIVDLKNFGFPWWIVKAVDAITKRPGERYTDYIKRVKTNVLARIVKIADLKHNMDILRLPSMSKADFNRLKKYQKAYTELFIG